MLANRVMLVEDDASVARFVSLALEDLPIELLVCGDVASALASLRQQPCLLIITDLMLPGESGLDLIRQLRADASLLGPARIVVYSAGLHAEVRAQLERYSVWRMLSKPVSVNELARCVEDALELANAGSGFADASPAPPSAGFADRATAEIEAIQMHFEGDAGLFDEYRASCLEQFRKDIALGDLASPVPECADLQQLAHNLKTVLATLGHPDGSLIAAALEQSAAAREPLAASRGWASLRSYLISIISP